MTDERTTAPPRAETPRLWTVAELAAAVARALSHDYSGAGSGRVTDVPGVRVIRWYQTIGLVDRPAEMRGRTALYGPRHLRQIVAIKRLQSAGHSLAEIQEALVGVPDEQLDRVARVPDAAWGEDGDVVAASASAERSGAPAPGAVPPEPQAPTGSMPPAAPELVDARSLPVAVEVEAAAERGRFWARRATPASLAASAAGPDAATPDAATPDTATSPELSYGIPLAPGVTVLVSLSHAPSSAAIAAIRASAAPLVAELSAQRADGTAPEAFESSTSTTNAPAARGLTEGASS